VLRSPYSDTLSCIVSSAHLVMPLRIEAEQCSGKATYPQRSTDLFKRGKGERTTEWLSRFIVHHAARDCASVSQRVILGDILFHNAAVTERTHFKSYFNTYCVLIYCVIFLMTFFYQKNLFYKVV